jgi:hypothetical protein
MVRKESIETGKVGVYCASRRHVGAEKLWKSFLQVERSGTCVQTGDMHVRGRGADSAHIGIHDTTESGGDAQVGNGRDIPGQPVH